MKIRVVLEFDADALLTQGFEKIMEDASLEADGTVSIPRSFGPLRTWGDLANNNKRASGTWQSVTE
jgi:hypothetical protein